MFVSACVIADASRNKPELYGEESLHPFIVFLAFEYEANANTTWIKFAFGYKTRN
ncbi:hypothetical protein FACS1894113_2490 [Alphaproteobacteria bacterium]|nr:hypothetical protein FACS1894113_2490 [Alphaproteobacteria bacterium]